MSGKLFLLFALGVACVKAQDHSLCPCDPKHSSEDKKMLSLLLEKLSSNVEDKERVLYSVYPGLLNEFSCNCDSQRKIPEQPVELTVNPDSVVREKKSIHVQDRRCPEGAVRFAFRCVPEDRISIVDYADDN